MEMKSKNMRPLKPRLPEVRCFRCNRLLFCGIAEALEIKCSRCGALQHIGNCTRESGLIVHNC